jgi:hypothetical protein
LIVIGAANDPDLSIYLRDFGVKKIERPLSIVEDTSLTVVALTLRMLANSNLLLTV